MELLSLRSVRQKLVALVLLATLGAIVVAIVALFIGLFLTSSGITGRAASLRGR